MQRVLPVTIFYGKTPLFAKYAIMSARRAFGEEFTVLADAPSPKDGYLCFQDYASEDVVRFQDAYQHFSVNGYASELFCFLRWFYLRDCARAGGHTHILHFDHDVLVCGTRKDILGSLQEHDLCISHISGHTGWFTLQALEALCEYLSYFVRDGFREHLQRHHRRYAAALEARTPFAVSDMSALEDFFALSPLKKSNAPVGIMVNVNLPEHGCVINPKTGILDLYVYNGGVYSKKENGEFLRWFTLHFQGAAKRHLPALYKLFLHHPEAQTDGYIRYCG